MKKNIPKLSIITINYNNKTGLIKTIDSVIYQTFQDIEYIIIDGGSTDGSREYIEQIQEHVDYWVSEPDKGIYNAMNKGIKEVNGEYCLFLNSGDYLINNKILEEVFKHKIKKDIIFGNFLKKFVNGETEPVIFSGAIDFDFFTQNNYNSLPHTSSFIRTNLFDKTGLYNEDYKIVSDWEFFLLSVCKYNCSFHYLPIVISVFDMGGVSSNELNEKLIRTERELVLEQHFPAYLNIINELSNLRQFQKKMNKSLPFKVYKKFKNLVN